MNKKNQRKNCGFALLFSVLISSFLLTVGLSIFSIALKELSISTATRQSVHAFFAADSGREYLLYQDLKLGLLFTLEDIKVETPTEIIVSGIVDEGNLANYSAQITKQWADSSKERVLTTVVSRGYDTDSDNKVERAIEQTY